MTNNQMMTAGAVAFAAFALWYVFGKPQTGGALARQAGQQARDAGLAQWFDVVNTQAGLSLQSRQASAAQISMLTGQPLLSFSLPAQTYF